MQKTIVFLTKDGKTHFRRPDILAAARICNEDPNPILNKFKAAHGVYVLGQVKPKKDSEVLGDLQERFDMLGKLTHGATRSQIRSLVVTGAPGVGKSHTVFSILEQMPEEKREVVKGGLSAVELYKLGYRMRRPGSVIVLDDADGIFTDEEALNILKALCDSSDVRRVNWLKDSASLRDDDIPQSYEFNGSFIFISNLNMASIAEAGGNKFAPHMEALISRSLYLDLQLHDAQAVNLWIRHVATFGKLFEREGVPENLGKEILDFISDNRDNLRELSLRTLVKACGLVKAWPREWQAMARFTLCR